MKPTNSISMKRAVAHLVFAAALAVPFVFSGVFAAGPSIRNVNPQGTVTNGYPEITLDTEDLARCKYDTRDAGYNDMGETLTTPDGLYHSASLGSLSKGSYTYYVRCRDFEGNSNSSSVEVKFKVGTVSCIGDNCEDNSSGGADAPVLSGFLPSGTVYENYVTLSLVTSKAANCRYSWYDRAYDAMTLNFSSSDRLYHTAAKPLWGGGYYTWYVRCKDDAGNVNSPAGKISYYYKAPYVAPVTPVAPVDSTAPDISGLAPSGEIDTATTTISCETDEAATCKYDISDADYDMLAETLESDAGKTAHSKIITLPAAGSYNYYVRCQDKAGNTDSSSGEISFSYVIPVKKMPVISNLQPTGAIYQDNVALILQTADPADCRYSDSDIDYDSMRESFSTNDGLLQQATVSLVDYGPYAYYVRCKDKEGNANDQSETINFEYNNPDDTSGIPGVENPTTTVECEGGAAKEGRDGVCDKEQNCICDSDCDISGENADPDCANLTVEKPSTAWIVLLFIGLLFAIIIVIIVIVIKRRASADEEVELP